MIIKIIVKHLASSSNSKLPITLFRTIYYDSTKLKMSKVLIKSAVCQNSKHFNNKGLTV